MRRKPSEWKETYQDMEYTKSISKNVKLSLKMTFSVLAPSGYAVPKSILDATRVTKETLETKNPNRKEIPWHSP